MPTPSHDHHSLYQNLVDQGHNLGITNEVYATCFGWPSTGGVWVLKPTKAQAKELEKLGVTEDPDEGCRFLQQVGATFYSDPNDSEDAKAVLTCAPIEEPKQADRDTKSQTRT